MIWTCPKCGREFTRRLSFDDHLADHAWRERHPTSVQLTNQDRAFLRQLHIVDTSEAAA